MKTNAAHFRLSDQELELIDARAAELGVRRSEYLRRSALHFAGGISSEDALALDFNKLLRNLNGAMNNLNQLVRAVHRGRASLGASEMETVQKAAIAAKMAATLYEQYLEALKERAAFPPEGGEQ